MPARLATLLVWEERVSYESTLKALNWSKRVLSRVNKLAKRTNSMAVSSFWTLARMLRANHRCFNRRHNVENLPKTKMHLVVFVRGSIYVSASAYSNEVIWNENAAANIAAATWNRKGRQFGAWISPFSPEPRKTYSRRWQADFARTRPRTLWALRLVL